MLITGMKRSGSRRQLGGAVLLVLALSVTAARHAEAGSYFGYHHGYGGSPYHGHYSHGHFGGYHAHPGGPYYYSPRFALNYARKARLGALELDVNPKKAEVYIDGRYVGRAHELDGYPDYLWLDAGTHQVDFYREGFATVTSEYPAPSGFHPWLAGRSLPSRGLFGSAL